ncbi:MAG TPA: DNA gyrase inhibitor YacG [Planctomycetes bacterium]|nr:DNA gyrase inhibitor YacG [Planctomycetota bacterium]
MSSDSARCPICDNALGPDAVIPFCSQRCKQVDLANWMDGTYESLVEGASLDGELDAREQEGSESESESED